MSMKKQTLNKVAALARELADMADSIVEEIQNQTTYEQVAGGHYEQVPAWPDGPAPDSAVHSGYSKSTAALKRRSMDLTRLLAELRRVTA